ncbi:hypothetical protein EJ110_NYTH11775 [Nymphaea thermarum]|nr:hypothetical protein EJ110_NYTH11775 [Nymphaea thermarum]
MVSGEPNVDMDDEEPFEIVVVDGKTRVLIPESVLYEMNTFSTTTRGIAASPLALRHRLSAPLPAAQTWWHIPEGGDMYKEEFSKGNRVVGILWSNKRDSGLWFAPAEWRECRLSIHMLPILPITEVLFSNADFVKQLVNWVVPVLGRDGVGDGWKGFAYTMEAIYDKESALKKIRTLNGHDDGNSLTNLFWWAYSRRVLGMGMTLGVSAVGLVMAIEDARVKDDMSMHFSEPPTSITDTVSLWKTVVDAVAHAAPIKWIPTPDCFPYSKYEEIGHFAVKRYNEQNQGSLRFVAVNHCSKLDRGTNHYIYHFITIVSGGRKYETEVLEDLPESGYTPVYNFGYFRPV